MFLNIIRTSTLYVDKSCQVTVQIKQVTGNITKILDTVEFTIPKPYEGHTDALDWECRKFLKSNGYPDITYDETPPTGVLPDNDL